MILFKIYRPLRRFRALRVKWIGLRALPCAYVRDRFPEGDVYRAWFAGLLVVVRIARC